jgi:uncharacterized protein (TIGR02246 family)
MRAVYVAIGLVLIGLGLWLAFTFRDKAPTDGMAGGEMVQVEADVGEEIATRLDLYQDALLRGDPEAFMSAYTSDARVYWPGMNVGRAELQTFVEESFPTVTWTGYDPKVTDLFVHGDAAYAIYEISETVQMEGQEAESEAWNCFTRWEKEEGVWKVDRDVCGPRDAPTEG